MHSRPCQPRLYSRPTLWLVAWLVGLLALGGVFGGLGGFGGIGQAQGQTGSEIQGGSVVDYGQWSALHGGPGHSGAAGFEPRAQPNLPAAEIAWKSSKLFGDPVSAAGIVVSGGTSTRPEGLTAVALASGEELWSVDLGGYILSAPAMDAAGRIFVEVIDAEAYGQGGIFGALWALEGSTGRVLWESNLTTYGGSPAVAEGTLLTFTARGLQALDPATGRWLWNYPILEAAVSPAVSDGLVVFVEDTTVRALKLADGSEAWNLSVPAQLGDVDPHVTLGEGLVIVRSDFATNLTVIDLAGGSPLGRLGSPEGKFVNLYLAIGPEAFYTLHENTTGQPSLMAFDRYNGNRLWSVPLAAEAYYRVTPVVTPHGVLTLDSEGGVRVWDLANGSLRATYFTQAPGTAASFSNSFLALAGDRLLVATPQGLVAFGTPAKGSLPSEGSAPEKDQGGFLSGPTSYISENGLIAFAILAGMLLGAFLARMSVGKKIIKLKNRLWHMEKKVEEKEAEGEFEGQTEQEGDEPDSDYPRQYSAGATPTTTGAKEIRRAVVVCGAGALTSAEQAALSGGAYLIAADGGANALYSLNRPPDLLIGDMDSITPQALEWCRRLGVPEEQHPQEKDATDGQLSIDAALERGASEILMVGALGGRTDHSYANMGLLEYIANEGAYGTIVGPDIDIYAVTPEQPLLQPATPNRTVSLIPLSDRVVGIYSRGLRYPLQGSTMLRTHTLGISNETVAELIEVRVGDGCLLVGVNRPADDLVGATPAR